MRSAHAKWRCCPGALRSHMPRSRQAALVSEWLRRRAAGSYQSIAGRLWGAVVSAWRCWAVHWPSHAIGTREKAMLSRCSPLSYAAVSAGCSCERMTASSGCWQLPVDCRSSMGCSSERMALLSRALALSCDRHTRNGDAVQVLSALICRGLGRLLLWANDCVVGLLAATSRLQAVYGVQ